MKEIVEKQLEELKTELNDHVLFMELNSFDEEGLVIAEQEKETYQYGIDLLLQIIRSYNMSQHI